MKIVFKAEGGCNIGEFPILSIFNEMKKEEWIKLFLEKHSTYNIKDKKVLDNELDKLFKDKKIELVDEENISLLEEFMSMLIDHRGISLEIGDEINLI